MPKKILALAAALAVAGTLVVGQAVPAGTGLIAYWTLNELQANTTAADTGSAPSNNGTYMGTTLPTTSASVPMVGGLAHPPGNTASRTFTQSVGNQLVDVPDSAELNLTGSFTLAAWVRPTGAQTNQLCIIEKWSGAGFINGYFLRLSSTMVPKVSIGNGTAQYEVASAGYTTLTAGAWTHLAATFNGTNTLNLYINGTLNNSSNTVVPPTVSTGSNLHIGVDYGQNRFNGEIDDARIYDRQLSDAEVGVLANGLTPPVLGAPVPGPGFVDLAWGAVANATSYQVFQGASGTGPWTLVGAPTGTTFRDTAVINPTQYWYYVVAVGLIESPPSNIQGPVVPQSLVPRTKDHEEGFIDDNCACGSTIASPPPLLCLLALAALPLLRRRRAPLP